MPPVAHGNRKIGRPPESNKDSNTELAVSPDGAPLSALTALYPKKQVSPLILYQMPEVAHAAERDTVCIVKIVRAVVRRAYKIE